MRTLKTIFSLIQVEIKNIKIEPKKINFFGWVMTSFFALLTGWGFWHQWSTVFLWLTGLTCLFFLSLRLIKNRWLGFIYFYWMMIGAVIGFFIFRLLLVVIYFCAILPVGLAFRLYKRLKSRECRDKQSSYWHPCSPEEQSIRIS